MNARNLLIAKIHIAKNELELDDATYRLALKSATKKTSCVDMNIFELEKTIQHFKKKGWKPRKSSTKISPSRHKRSDDKTQADKIKALWLELYQSGAIKNDSEQALNNFIKRITKIHNVAWLNACDANIVIEALKSWQRRHHDYSS